MTRATIKTQTGSGMDMKGQNMPRETIQMTIPDLSAFTKQLRQALMQQEALPGHAAMLSLVSKAAGYENFQHLKAVKPQSKTLGKQLEKALRVFDETGVMTRWPNQTAIQGLCLWRFWADLPVRQDLTETEVNEMLKAGSSFGDHVLLRRSLIDHKLVTRTRDGKAYRRIEKAPPADAVALIKSVYRPS